MVSLAMLKSIIWFVIHSCCQVWQNFISIQVDILQLEICFLMSEAELGIGQKDYIRPNDLKFVL